MSEGEKMKSSRDQFEEWCTRGMNWVKNVAVERNDSGEYRLNTTQKKWEAWQASREAMLSHLNLS